MRNSSPGLLLFALATSLAAAPASAQFYRLDGRFECLERPGAVCYDASVAPAPAPAPTQAAVHDTAPAEKPPEPQNHPKLEDLRELLAEIRAEPPVAPTVPVDPLKAIALRIEAKSPLPSDLAILEADAKGGDLRAVELLAWCAFAGIGGKPDPIRAYFLYGEAAAAGVKGMAKNQAAVYATMLTSEQRQQIAEIENSQ